MKKIFNDLMEKKAQEAIKKENEQIMRKARLSELEEKNKSMRHKLLHPIKSANDGKEIKKLKEDIAAFENEKDNNRLLMISGGLFCFLMIMLFATGMFGKSSNDKADEAPVAMTVTETKTETVAEAKTEKPIESTEEAPAVIEDEQTSGDSSTGYKEEEVDDSEEKDNEIVNETSYKDDTESESVEQGEQETEEQKSRFEVIYGDYRKKRTTIYYMVDFDSNETVACTTKRRRRGPREVSKVSTYEITGDINGWEMEYNGEYHKYQIEDNPDSDSEYSNQIVVEYTIDGVKVATYLRLSGPPDEFED